ncbi:MAG TPA: hypothetical protein VLA09_13455, partial [Longimicrobiales bacterium]|nr:hypothetical protein [Longimicrobiales bacterium]
KELPTGPRSRLTFHEALERKPRWTSDSRSVTFLSERDGDLDIWTRNADGTGEPRKLFDFERGLAEGFWSPGEEWLILRVGGIEGSAEGARDIMGFRPGVDSAAVPLVATSQYAEESPAISPDGRWLAYASDETGRAEIYVRPFPDVDSDRVAVSRSGGFKPLWGPDGSELFFVNPGTRELMSAAVETTSRFQVRGVESLFTIPDGYFVGRTADFYDVSRDGERFLMARLAALAAEFSPELILVQNWFEELKERVPR